MAVRKTALLIDDELIAQAKAILGTRTTTETLHEALLQVIRIEGRARGLERLRRREGFDLHDPEAGQGAWRTGGRG
jgi:Arc/MetJ family transcription regulator